MTIPFIGKLKGSSTISYDYSGFVDLYVDQGGTFSVGGRESNGVGIVYTNRPGLFNYQKAGINVIGEGNLNDSTSRSNIPKYLFADMFYPAKMSNSDNADQDLVGAIEIVKVNNEWKAVWTKYYVDANGSETGTRTVDVGNPSEAYRIVIRIPVSYHGAYLCDSGSGVNDKPVYAGFGIVVRSKFNGQQYESGSSTFIYKPNVTPTYPVAEREDVPELFSQESSSIGVSESEYKDLDLEIEPRASGDVVVGKWVESGYGDDTNTVVTNTVKIRSYNTTDSNYSSLSYYDLCMLVNKLYGSTSNDTGSVPDPVSGTDFIKG